MLYAVYWKGDLGNCVYVYNFILMYKYLLAVLFIPACVTIWKVSVCLSILYTLSAVLSSLIGYMYVFVIHTVQKHAHVITYMSFLLLYKSAKCRQQLKLNLLTKSVDNSQTSILLFFFEVKENLCCVDECIFLVCFILSYLLFFI